MISMRNKIKNTDPFDGGVHRNVDIGAIAWATILHVVVAANIIYYLLEDFFPPWVYLRSI